jgi:hypothetical protein
VTPQEKLVQISQSQWLLEAGRTFTFDENLVLTRPGNVDWLVARIFQLETMLSIAKSNVHSPTCSNILPPWKCDCSCDERNAAIELTLNAMPEATT